MRSLYWARELPEAESILPIGAITSFLGALLFLQFLAILGDGGSGKSGKSVRLVSKPKPEGMTKEVCCVNYEAVVGLKTVKSRCLSLVFRKPVCVVDPSKQFLIDIFCFFNHNVGCPPSGIRLRFDPSVITRYGFGSSFFFLTRRKEAQAKICLFVNVICVFCTLIFVSGYRFNTASEKASYNGSASGCCSKNIRVSASIYLHPPIKIFRFSILKYSINPVSVSIQFPSPALKDAPCT